MIGQGISEVMVFAVGVAISPLPIIAVVLVLFSDRARVNAPVFLLGWVVWLGTPHINRVSQQQKLTAPGLSNDLEIQAYVLPVLITALVVGLLPFLKPKELIRSGERPKAVEHGGETS